MKGKERRIRMEYVIEMQDVVRNFDRKEVLKGVNLKVSPGEILS